MNKLGRFIGRAGNHPVTSCAVVAVLLNLYIETFARQNIFGGLQFMVQSPIVFFYNALIIFASLSVASLFRRRIFVMTLISMVWFALGTANGVILINRMTPFTVYDLQSFKDGLSIATNYFTKAQLVGMVAGVAALIVFILVLWRKAPKKDKVNYRRDIAAILCILALTFGTSGLVIKAGIVDTYFPNLAYGYSDNGVPYCFINTWLNTGVSRPEDYSEELIDGIFTDEQKKIAEGDGVSTSGDARPNIIFVQLESLMDPLTVKGVEFSEDPIPNLRKLYKECSSGRITMPAVGAGTANVEFESMTGMSVKFFGPGEYPHKNILKEETCESIPYNLKKLGYTTHAIHNHRGVFYNRNIVFPHLGFDTFTSLEYMNNVSKTPKNWARDNVLISQINDALQSTEGSDYIYTISVQGHGSYPTEKVIEDPEITVTEAPTEELRWQYEYYVNQVYEMDQFVGAFIEEMKKFDEDTVVVMYGDHLPAIENLTDDNLKYGRSAYQTDYFIWANFPFEKQDKDLACYQIGAEVLNRLDIHTGTLTTLHQYKQNDEDYLKDLHDLQYDMLYGEKYIYGGKDKWKPTDMKMGVRDITIESVVKIGDKYYIRGQNFTESSRINLDGEILDTVYLGPTILGVRESIDEEDVSRMKISQYDKSEKKILSTTE